MAENPADLSGDASTLPAQRRRPDFADGRLFTRSRADAAVDAAQPEAGRSGGERELAALVRELGPDLEKHREHRVDRR